jgi:hypothetical protein
MKIKEQSTGDNDSVEDAILAIMHIKTEDGKILNGLDAWMAVRNFMDTVYRVTDNK